MFHDSAELWREGVVFCVPPDARSNGVRRSARSVHPLGE